MLDFLPAVLRTPVAFVIVLGVLVFIHELGHYLAARWRGVHVEAFSIGFGRELVRWTDRQGTVWKVAWIPLGGYVKLHGQQPPQDVPEEVRASLLPGRTFHEKDVGSRAIVIAAGPVANFLLAAFLFALLFATAGRPVVMPVVGDVLSGSAADRGGIKVGDRVLSLAGKRIDHFEDIQRIVAVNPGRPLPVTVSNDGVTRELTVTPDARGDDTHRVGVLGIRGGATAYEALPVWEALPAGVAQTWQISVETLDAIWGMIAHDRSTADLGGPLRIAQLSGQVAELGPASLISFIALLSVNLGLINLFPIPVLDGGHLLFCLAEAARGRPLPPRAMEYGFRAGLALLVCLFVFATWNDLAHIGVFRWVAGLID